MQLEDYFTFLAPDDIRLRGHRIGIESILYEYIHRGQTPEQIAQTYPTLSLEEVYATVLYYLHNREAVAAYVSDWLDYCHRAELEHDRAPSQAALRLRAVRDERAGVADTVRAA